MRLIGLILVFFTSFACYLKQGSENKKEQIKEKQPTFNLTDSDSSRLGFQPDTLIQGFLALNTPSLSARFKEELIAKNQVDFLRESPVFVFSTKHQQEYVLTYQYEGSSRGEFSCFEIGYRSDLEINESITSVGLDQFILESGIQLGLTLDDLVKIKGNSYREDKDAVIYTIDDYLGSTFLKKHNMPAYFLKCTFKDNKINNIKFGFEYP